MKRHEKDSNDPRTKIRLACRECGIAANVVTCLKRYGERPNQLAFSVSTFHKGRCDWCGEEKDVTEARDYFYPDFGLLEEAAKALKEQ